MESKKVKDFKKEERMEKEREKIINDINKEIDKEIFKEEFMTQKEKMEKEVYYDLTGKTGRGADSRLWYATLDCGQTLDFSRHFLFLSLLRKYWFINYDNRVWLSYFTTEATKLYKKHYQREAKSKGGELHYELPSQYSIKGMLNILKDPLRDHSVYISELLLLVFFNFGERGKNAVVNFILGSWKWAFTKQQGLTWDFNNFFEEYFNEEKGGKNGQ